MRTPSLRSNMLSCDLLAQSLRRLKHGSWPFEAGQRAAGEHFVADDLAVAERDHRLKVRNDRPLAHQAVELAERFDDDERTFRDGSHVRIVALALHAEGFAGEIEQVAVVQWLAAGHAAAIDEGAVRAAQVVNVQMPCLGHDLGVLLGDLGGGNAQGALRQSAHHERKIAEGDGPRLGHRTAGTR